MNAKYVIFVAFAVVYSNGRAIDQASDHCVDSYELCKRIPKEHCQHISFLKTVCPLTCGECEDPCSINNGGCNQFCSGVTEAQCSCRDGYQLATDRKTCIDLNECSAGTNRCSQENKICINSIGSFSCQLVDCKDIEKNLKNYYKSDFCCLDVARDQMDIIEKRNFLKTDSRNSTLNQWPWMVQLLNEGKHLCGATLVAQSWLLTAASCIKDYHHSSLTAVLGDVTNAQITWRMTSQRVERKLIKVVIYPGPINHDIALIQLSVPVKFNQIIQPIQLPCGELPDDGVRCYVTGYNHTEHETFSSSNSFLHEAALPVIPDFYCKLVLNSTFNSTTEFCAGSITKGSEINQGFTGGPLMCQRSDSCQWYLSGIMTSQRKRKFIRFFAKVAHYENWIEEVLRNDYINRC